MRNIKIRLFYKNVEPIHERISPIIFIKIGAIAICATCITYEIIVPFTSAFSFTEPIIILTAKNNPHNIETIIATVNIKL